MPISIFLTMEISVPCQCKRRGMCAAQKSQCRIVRCDTDLHKARGIITICGVWIGNAPNRLWLARSVQQWRGIECGSKCRCLIKNLALRRKLCINSSPSLGNLQAVHSGPEGGCLPSGPLDGPRPGGKGG